MTQPKDMTEGQLLDALAEEYPAYEATVQAGASGEEAKPLSQRWNDLYDEATRRGIDDALDKAALLAQHRDSQ